MRIHTELCKATVESTRLEARHLKLRDSEVKLRGKISNINQIGNVFEDQLTGRAGEDKDDFIRLVAEILIALPPLLEDVDKDKFDLSV